MPHLSEKQKQMDFLKLGSSSLGKLTELHSPSSSILSGSLGRNNKGSAHSEGTGLISRLFGPHARHISHWILRNPPWSSRTEMSPRAYIKLKVVWNFTYMVKTKLKPGLQSPQIKPLSFPDPAHLSDSFNVSQSSPTLSRPWKLTGFQKMPGPCPCQKSSAPLAMEARWEHEQDQGPPLLAPTARLP